MCRHHNGCKPVSVDVADLGIPHATEPPTEISFPERFVTPVGLPQLDRRLSTAEGQDSPRPVGRAVSHYLVENVALRILNPAVTPLFTLRPENSHASRERLRLALAKNGKSQEQNPILCRSGPGGAGS